MFANRFAANRLAANKFAANNRIANRFAPLPNHKDFQGFTSPVKKEEKLCQVPCPGLELPGTSRL